MGLQTHAELRSTVIFLNRNPHRFGAGDTVSTVKMTSTAPFIRSVVHATDFSAADERAFAHALGVALLVRASFTILHVTSDASADWSGFPAVRKTLERWKLLEPGSAARSRVREARCERQEVGDPEPVSRFGRGAAYRRGASRLARRRDRGPRRRRTLVARLRGRSDGTVVADDDAIRAGRRGAQRRGAGRRQPYARQRADSRRPRAGSRAPQSSSRAARPRS